MKGYTYNASAKNPPMPQSGWRTGCFGQVVGVKIQSDRYYKTICPTQNVKISIIINIDTNLLQQYEISDPDPKFFGLYSFSIILEPTIMR